MSDTTPRINAGGLFRGRPRAALTLALLAAALVLASPAEAGSANIVAQALRSTVAVYRHPGAAKPFLTLRSPTAQHARLTFLVKGRGAGWEQVYLAIRPNGATGWVRDRAVSLSLNSYVVEVSLRRHHITVWNGNSVIDSEPAGVGRAVLPTPTGTYFIVSLLKQANPNLVYGPYAFGLSAYSTRLFSFGGGPGEIGLHGTNDPASLGHNVSHGCIRISNHGIRKLAGLLPLGTPVLIRP